MKGVLLLGRRNGAHSILVSRGVVTHASRLRRFLFAQAYRRRNATSMPVAPGFAPEMKALDVPARPLSRAGLRCPGDATARGRRLSACR